MLKRYYLLLPELRKKKANLYKKYEKAVRLKGGDSSADNNDSLLLKEKKKTISKLKDLQFKLEHNVEPLANLHSKFTTTLLAFQEELNNQK